MAWASRCGRGGGPARLKHQGPNRGLKRYYSLFRINNRSRPISAFDVAVAASFFLVMGRSISLCPSRLFLALCDQAFQGVAKFG
jgi:hypothetical protein